MNNDIANLKATACNSDLSEEIRHSAVEQLRAIAGRSHDARHIDAEIVVRELEAVSAAKPAPDQTVVDTLQAEVLTESHASSIKDVEYGDAAHFCSEKGWSKPGVMELWFERWLPAYFETEQGAAKLATLESYWLRSIGIDGDTADLFAEVRRRAKLDADFAALLTSEDKELFGIALVPTPA
jgi:hypothetical protein